MDGRARHNEINKLSILSRIAVALNNWTSRWVPSAFSIAIVLTLITFAAGSLLTANSLWDCIRLWGDGFWELLAFSMQMTLIMVTGYVVVVSPPVNSLERFDRAITTSNLVQRKHQAPPR